MKRLGIAIAALGLTVGLTLLMLGESGMWAYWSEGWTYRCAERLGPGDTTGPIEGCMMAYAFWFGSVPLFSAVGAIFLGALMFAIGSVGGRAHRASGEQA